jgi:multiple sugar transport system permease protein
MDLNKNYKMGITWLVIAGYMMIAGVPILWTMITSVRPEADIFQFPIKFLPSKLQVGHYKGVFVETPFLKFIFNTVILAGVTTFICIFFGSMAAYGLARFDFRFNTLILMLFLGFRLFPPTCLLPAFYILFDKLNLLDRIVALIIANTYFNLPISIWLLRGFFRDIPYEISDAAKIDGCSNFGVYWRMMIFLAAPGIAAAAIIVFLFTWNEFVFAVTLTSSESARVISVGIYHFIGDITIDWNRLSAAGVLASLPAIFFVFLFQRHIVSGLAAGSVK